MKILKRDGRNFSDGKCNICTKIYVGDVREKFNISDTMREKRRALAAVSVCYLYFEISAQIRFIRMLKTNANCIYYSKLLCVHTSSGKRSTTLIREIHAQVANKSVLVHLQYDSLYFSPPNSRVCILKRVFLVPD